MLSVVVAINVLAGGKGSSPAPVVSPGSNANIADSVLCADVKDPAGDTTSTLDDAEQGATAALVSLAKQWLQVYRAQQGMNDIGDTSGAVDAIPQVADAAAAVESWCGANLTIFNG